MAQISFNDIQAEERNFNSDRTSVGFFNLANDGDEAIVRFMHDDISSFDILTTHPITLNGKYRKVSCIRDPRQPMDNCPLCQSGVAVNQRIFIHLIQYTKDANGNIVAEPKVWERAITYANTLKSYIDNYGPLSDIMCKVIRHGAKGNMQTTYEIVPNLNKTIYRDDLYIKKPEFFENYKALGTVVLDKDFSELSQFLATGSFPVKVADNNQQAAPQYQAPAAPQYTAPAQPQYTTPPQYQAPAAPVGGPADMQQAAPGIQKPARYY